MGSVFLPRERCSILMLQGRIPFGKMRLEEGTHGVGLGFVLFYFI